MITDLNTSMPSTSLSLSLSLSTAVARYNLPFDSKLRFSTYLVLDEKEMHVAIPKSRNTIKLRRSRQSLYR